MMAARPSSEAIGVATISSRLWLGGSSGWKTWRGNFGTVSVSQEDWENERFSDSSEGKGDGAPRPRGAGGTSVNLISQLAPGNEISGSRIIEGPAG